MSEDAKASYVTPESLGLSPCEVEQTYLAGSGCDRVWIGDKWDIAAGPNTYVLWRKGNYVITVRSLELACQIIADQEYLTTAQDCP